MIRVHHLYMKRRSANPYRTPAYLRHCSRVEDRNPPDDPDGTWLAMLCNPAGVAKAIERRVKRLNKEG